jgi:hypothetical protein
MGRTRQRPDWLAEASEENDGGNINDTARCQRGQGLAGAPPVKAALADDRRRYRKIFCRLWRNPDFQTLDRDAQVVTFYLLTGPQTNRIGLFLVSPGGASDDLRMPPEAFTAAVRSVCGAFDWLYEDATRVIWIPSWWRFNTISDNVNNIKGALTDLDEVPASSLIARFCKHLPFVPAVHHPLFAAAHRRYAVRTPSRHRSNGVATQDQDQDQDQDQEQESTAAPAAPPAPPVVPALAKPLPDVARVVAHYCKQFKARYGASPDIVGKDAGQFATLTRKHGADLVIQRIDLWFSDPDPFCAQSGHVPGAFVSAWNKLVALAARRDGLEQAPAGNQLSPRGQRNLAAAQSYLRDVGQA